MDSLFERYANPFLFVDGMIQTGRFSEFVSSFLERINKEKEEDTSWQFFLHKVFKGSYADFKAEMRNDAANKHMSEETLETTIKHSMNILNKFNPDQNGGES